MAGVNQSIDGYGGRENGLHFTNNAWNDTITNGNDFILRWNQTIEATLGTLGLFTVSYPSQGVVVYEEAQNMTNCIQPTYCKWKPESLGDELYSFWLTSDRGPNGSFAISPAWTAKQPKVHSFTWAAPFLVPICLLLFLYCVCVATCLLYKKRRIAKRRRKAAARAARRRALSGAENGSGDFHMMTIEHANRQASVDSNATLEALESPGGLPVKPDEWLIGIAISCNSISNDTVVSESSEVAEQRAAHKKALAKSAVRFVRRGSNF